VALALACALALLATPLTIPESGGPGATPVEPRALFTVTLQPDPVNGTDAFILDITPAANYGNNVSLLVGRDAGNASLTRSLLRFDLSSLPAGATIVNANLEATQLWGGAGVVQVRRAGAPWQEGFGENEWTRVPVTVRETAGARRVSEPVELTIPFAPYTIAIPERDLRTMDGGSVVPSQVYAPTFAGGQVASAKLVFGASVGPYATKTYEVYYSRNGTAVPAYRTKTWSAGPLWTWNSGTGSSGASIVDLDGDGALDVVFGGQDGYVYALTGTGQQKWATQVSTVRSIPYTPQIRDMDGDGALDIVVVANDPAIVRLNNAGGIVWRQPLALGSTPYAPPVLVEVNGDGVLDVVYSGRGGAATALDGVTHTAIQTFPATDWAYGVAVADLDGDGQAELFFSSDDTFAYSYDVSGAQRWATSPVPATWLENAVALADTDNDGTLEVIVVDEDSGSPFYAFNAVTGALEWTAPIPVPGWKEGGQTLADLNGDGSLEILIGVETGGLYAFRGSDGTYLWDHTDDAFQPLYPAVVDLDKDGSRDVAYLEEGQGGLAALRILDRNGNLIRRWNTSANIPGLRGLSQFALYTPAIADLDADGTLEIVIPTGIGVEVYGTGGLARDWRTWGYNWNHTHLAHDGASPTGVPFLEVSMGSPQTYPAAGVSWSYRDGIAAWATAGGDYGSAESASAAAPGTVTWNVTAMVRDWFTGAYPNAGVVLTESNEASGPVHAFASSDDADPARRPRLRIVYDAPIFDPTPRLTGVIPDTNRIEDEAPWSILLSGLVRDDDTPLSGLRWNVSGFDPDIVSIGGLETPGNHLLTFYPQPDAWGSMRVTYWLTDSDGHWTRQAAWINISAVNDPPGFSPPGVLVVRHDEPYTFNFAPYISDIDDPMAQISLLTDDPTRAVASGLNVTFLYPESLLDQWVFITLTVSDGKDTTSRVVAVKVTSDRPPVLDLELPDLVMVEGERRVGVFDLDDYFTDPDLDALFYSGGYTHLNVTIHANHSVDVEAHSNWFGWEQVTFRAEDPTGAIAEDTIIITVLPIDDPPTIGNVPNLTVRFDEPYSFDLGPYIRDPDTPAGALTITTSSAFISVSGRLLTLLYPVGMNGSTEDVTITVSDGTSVATRTVRVRVGDDYPPVLVARLADTSLLEDETRTGVYNLSAFFDDPEDTQLFYSYGSMSVIVSIDGRGIVDLSAVANWSGVEQITFRATDAAGALAEDTVQVSVQPVNDAPWFEGLPNFVVNATTAFVDLAPHLRDIDTPLPELVLTTTNNRARVVGQGLLLDFEGPGPQDILVELSDGEFSVVRAVRVTVVLLAPGEIPGYVFLLPILATVGGTAALIVYRRRKVEWAFLVTNVGILVASVSRKEPTALDTDIVTGMLTTIMDFAKRSFSDETERNLEGLDIGDESVTIVRGRKSYLAVVFTGRMPGTLPRVMRSCLDAIEGEHSDALGDVIDMSTLGNIPETLGRLVRWGWWPFLRFHANGATTVPADRTPAGP